MNTTDSIIITIIILSFGGGWLIGYLRGKESAVYRELEY